MAQLESDPVNSSPELGLRSGDEAADDAVGSVPGEDLTDPIIDAHREPVGGDCHVAEDQPVDQLWRAHRELEESLVEATLVRLNGSAGVMSDEVHHLVINADGPKVAGPVQGVKAGLQRSPRVADVMQDGGLGQKGSVCPGRGDHRTDLERPIANTLRVCPSPR